MKEEGGGMSKKYPPIKDEYKDKENLIKSKNLLK